MLDAFRPAVACDTVKCLVPPRFKTGEHLTRSSTLSFGDRDAEKALEGWVEGDVALIHGAAGLIADEF